MVEGKKYRRVSIKERVYSQVPRFPDYFWRSDDYIKKKRHKKDLIDNLLTLSPHFILCYPLPSSSTNSISSVDENQYSTIFTAKQITNLLFSLLA